MSFEEDFQTIKQLTETQACTGNEKPIREYIQKTIENFCDKVETDYIGNLICSIYGKGTTKGDKLKVMLDCHMDEIGFMVRFIDKNGFIRFSQVGGQNPRLLPGQTVTVHASSGEDIVGVIGEKPIHLLEEEERKKTSKIDDLFIDVGMRSDEEVKKDIAIGDYITLKQDCTAFKGNKRIFSKAFDDRAGCFVLMKLIMELSAIKDKLDKNIIFLFATQEEIGVRGATIGAYKISPNVSITVEVTHAIDYPTLTKEKQYECDLGGGPSIAVGPNLYPKLTKLLAETAKQEKIPFVLEPEPTPTGTNARAIQMTKEGVPCALISTPLRYMHSNIETIEYEDLIRVVNILKAFLLKDLKTALIL